MYNILKNLSYSFSANLLSFGVSILMILLLPRFLSLEDYSMWQLFLFYFSYIGFFHFGWEDGMYLRYAGRKFKQLNVKLISGQLYGIFLLQVIVLLILWLFILLFVEDRVKAYVLKCAVVLIPMANIINACSQILQATNQIKKYAQLLIIGKLISVVLILISFFLGLNKYVHLYFTQLCSVLISFLISMYFFHDFLKSDFCPVKEIYCEAKKNISVGIKLMIANISGMLIGGIVRYGISVGWDITIFGKVSLTLNVSNFLLIFISAISVVLFPILKTINKPDLAILYVKLNNILSIFLLALLIAYYPLKTVLFYWLPQYEDSLGYMLILFPICIFESKMQLLINTYLKSMRQETLMLKIQIVGVLISIIITMLNVLWLHNLDIVVFSIIFLYALRYWIATFYLSRLLHIHLVKNILEETFLIFSFIISGVLLPNTLSALVYSILFIAFLFTKRKLLKKIYHN